MSSIENYQIILNTQEIDLKTDRTNSTTKGREEATLRKRGNAEMWLGEKWIMGAMEWGAVVAEKSKREECTGDCPKNVSPKPLAWKRRWAEFCKFLQPLGLKA